MEDLSADGIAGLDFDAATEIDDTVEIPGVDGDHFGVLPGQMHAVRYLISPHAPFYRLVLDVLLEEESMLGLHLSTVEIERRVQDRLRSELPVDVMPNTEDLLGRLYIWGNVDRIHNTRRKGTADQYLERDFLYQLTPAGAEVHRTLTQIDNELGNTGALQASMLPEVLNALHALQKALDLVGPTRREAELRPVYGALQRIIAGFSQLAENSRRFVQGLNAVVETGSTLTEQVFIAYKDDVVLYLQTFVMTLVRYSAPIANALNESERKGIRVHFADLALLEAAPTLGMSRHEVAERDAEVLQTQWEGLRGWFFGDAGRLPTTTALQDRASDAVSRIVSIVRKFHEQRFRRVDRANDFLVLAAWFTGMDDQQERATLWRSAFGMYSARHFGAPHNAMSDLDVRPNTSWWEPPPAPVEPRLRKHGPRARTGRPSRIGDARANKRRLAEMRAFERHIREQSIADFVAHTPTRMSALPVLSEDETELFLHCLRLVMAVRADSDDVRRVRTEGGRLAISLRCPPDGTASTAVVETTRGSIALEDFEIDIVDLLRGDV